MYRRFIVVSYVSISVTIGGPVGIRGGPFGVWRDVW